MTVDTRTTTSRVARALQRLNTGLEFAVLAIETLRLARDIVREELAALGLECSDAIGQVGDRRGEPVDHADVERQGLAHALSEVAEARLLAEFLIGTRRGNLRGLAAGLSWQNEPRAGGELLGDDVECVARDVHDASPSSSGETSKVRRGGGPASAAAPVRGQA